MGNASLTPFNVSGTTVEKAEPITLTVDNTFSVSSDNMGGFSAKVVNNGKTITEIAPPSAEKGTNSAPEMICVPFDWVWPLEGVNISSAYSGFKAWVEDKSALGWLTEIPQNVVNRPGLPDNSEEPAPWATSDGWVFERVFTTGEKIRFSDNDALDVTRCVYNSDFNNGICASLRNLKIPYSYTIYFDNKGYSFSCGLYRLNQSTKEEMAVRYYPKSNEDANQGITLKFPQSIINQGGPTAETSCVYFYDVPEDFNPGIIRIKITPQY